MATTPSHAARNAAVQARNAARDKGDLHDAYVSLLRAKAKLALQQSAKKRRPCATQAASSVDTELSTLGKLFKSDPYAALNVSPTANEKQVKKAYFKLARKYHPDKMGFGADEAAASGAHELFGQVSSAYDILSDPTKRSQADRARRNAPKPPRPPPQTRRPPRQQPPRPPSQQQQQYQRRAQPKPKPKPQPQPQPKRAAPTGASQGWRKAASGAPRTAGPSGSAHSEPRAPKPSEAAKAKARAASAAYKRTAAEKAETARADVERREAWRKKRWAKMKADAAADAARRAAQLHRDTEAFNARQHRAHAAEEQSAEAREARRQAQQEVREAETRAQKRKARTADLKRTAAERAAVERAAARARVDARRNRGGQRPEKEAEAARRGGVAAEQAAARARVEARATARTAARKAEAAKAKAARGKPPPMSERADAWQRKKAEIRARGLAREYADGTDADSVFSFENVERRRKAKKKARAAKAAEEAKKASAGGSSAEPPIPPPLAAAASPSAENDARAENAAQSRLRYAEDGLVTIVYDARLDKAGSLSSRVFGKGNGAGLSFQKRWCVLTSDGALWSAKERKHVWRAEDDGATSVRASAPGPHCKLLLKLKRNLTSVHLGLGNNDSAEATPTHDCAEDDDRVTFRVAVFGADGAPGVGSRTFRAPSRAERTTWISQLCGAVGMVPPVAATASPPAPAAAPASAAAVGKQTRSVAAAAAARVGSPRAAAGAGRHAKQRGWAWWRKESPGAGAAPPIPPTGGDAEEGEGGGVDDLEGEEGYGGAEYYADGPYGEVEEEDDGSKWQYAVDAESGRGYWEHIVTGESRWVAEEEEGPEAGGEVGEPTQQNWYWGEGAEAEAVAPPVPPPSE